MYVVFSLIDRYIDVFIKEMYNIWNTSNLSVSRVSNVVLGEMLSGVGISDFLNVALCEDGHYLIKPDRCFVTFNIYGWYKDLYKQLRYKNSLVALINRSNSLWLSICNNNYRVMSSANGQETVFGLFNVLIYCIERQELPNLGVVFVLYCMFVFSDSIFVRFEIVISDEGVPLGVFVDEDSTEDFVTSYHNDILYSYVAKRKLIACEGFWGDIYTGFRG